MPVLSKDAVLLAVQEFDQLGREAFLTKYGFGQAREFFLFHGGRFYDSKAIVGAAYGFASEDAQALTAQDFSGGEKTVKAALERLGFSVLRTRLADIAPAGEQRAAILTWNPDRWQWPDRSEIAERVASGENVRMRWSSGNTRTLPVGTRAFLLKQGDEPRGLVASGWTVSVPFEALHWDAARAAQGESANYVEAVFDVVLDERATPVDPREGGNALVEINWAIPASGTSIYGEAYSALESLWAAHDDRSPVGTRWSPEEIRASVESYFDMLQRVRRGERVVKSNYYRDLASRFGRSENAYEYRMQNISFVRAVSGRDWVSGLPPARNVGTSTATEIEAILAELEGRMADPAVAFETQVNVALAKPNQAKPTGNDAPKRSVASGTIFERDPEVKAWVLREANGKCECCKQAAPFSTPLGPFLEVHHVWRLADSGPDTVENAVAICPNCHRELHFGIHAKALIEQLYATIPRLMRPESRSELDAPPVISAGM
jgi:5-methylcytosine-specific restriction protein A